MIYYHGKTKWNYKKDIREMIPDFDMLPNYLKEMLPVLRHDFINISGYTEEDMMEYEPVTRMVLRSFKYIFYDKDTLIEMFVISVDEMQSELSEEEFNKYIGIMLLYYAAVKKDISEQDIVQKIQELDGKGSKIMTILEQREQKGIEQGILRVVKNAISKGMKTKDIVDIAGITEKEVEEIRRGMLGTDPKKL